MMLEEIRAAEVRSHIEVYSTHRLFEPGSWLSKPVRTVMDVLPLYQEVLEFRCLDLGCGVGRNAIPVAKHFSKINCQVDCVDILPLAIDRLLENAEIHGVEKEIHAILSPIEDFNIPEAAYDLILAVSALEHCGDENAFRNVLRHIRKGTRPGGSACLIINSGVREQDARTGEELVPQFEMNLETAALNKLLGESFQDWQVLKHTVQHQQYAIPRGERAVLLSTDVVTFVARK